MVVEISSVLVGRVAPLGRKGALSAIAKMPVTGRIAIGPTGLDGDEQADRRHHGGVEKAIHHYALDHAETWRSDLPSPPDLIGRAGAFGENFSSRGITEAETHVGDVWRAGTALLQVSQARQPCWKLNERFGVPDMARRVQTTGRTGWYYRVLEPGTVEPGDALVLVDRPCPDWPLARLLRVFYVDRLDREALAGIARLNLLTDSWRQLAARRLEREAVEDWAPRLEG